MPTIYDAIDLKFTWNGDYVEEDGDLADTESDQIVSLLQEVQTISNSQDGDWRDFQSYAASLNDLVGEPNNRTTATRMVESLRTALVTNKIVKRVDLSIRPIPVSRYEILIVIKIEAQPTSNNSLRIGEPPVVTLLYNYLEQGISYIENNQFIKSGSNN